MLDILRDGIWQFVGVVIALLALLTPFWFYLKQRGTKILTYDIKDATPLVAIHRSIRGNPILSNLKIFLGEQEVNNAYMSSVVFSNRGNAPITRHDYDECLSVELTETGQVVSCDIVDKNPATLNLELKLLDKSVNFKPFLLNKNDGFTVRSIIINGDVRIRPPTARIVGGEIKSREEIDNTAFRKVIRFLDYDYRAILVIWIVLVALSLSVSLFR